MSRKRSAALLAAAGLTAGVLSQSASAYVVGPSIGVKFGSDQPASTLAPTDVAGLLPSANWTNGANANGSLTNLNADVNGVSTPTAAGVTWTSNNTWASTGA